MLATVVQWLVLATLTGAAVGTGASLFLHVLFAATETTSTATAPFWLILLMLPAGGLLNGLLLHYGYRLNRTGLRDSVFAAVHQQGGRMPLLTLPIRPIAAVITLASGGSAGKEGPCSHIGASTGAMIGAALRLNSELRQRLVACGVSAGFAAVFGTPIGGAIYGVEVLAIGRIRYDFLLPAIVAGVTSYQVSTYWGIPYDTYRVVASLGFSEITFLKTAVIGLACGLAALVFVEMVHGFRRNFDRLRTRLGLWPPLMPVIGGLLVAALVVVIPADYLGLSLPLMNRALAGEAMPLAGFLWKALLVAITLGSGFYGGIVTPQFVIGAVLGSACAHLLGIEPTLGAAVGLVAVLAAASNTPIAAILMGLELFGTEAGVGYLAGSAVIAYLVIGHRSVYPEQRLTLAKSSWLRVRMDLPVGQEKTRLSNGLLRWLSRRKG